MLVVVDGVMVVVLVCGGSAGCVVVVLVCGGSAGVWW